MNDKQIQSLLEQHEINQQLEKGLIDLEQSIYATLDSKFLQDRLSQLQDKQKHLECEKKCLQRIIESAKDNWADRHQYSALQVFLGIHSYQSNL